MFLGTRDYTRGHWSIPSMINGAHFLIYSKNPEADRAFFHDVLQLRSVDLGHNWLIFAMPPTELAVHPADNNFVQKHADHELLGCVLYLMCDDLDKTIESIKAKNIPCASVETAPWGAFTILRLPSGGEIGLYQPSHVTAIETK